MPVLEELEELVVLVAIGEPVVLLEILVALVVVEIILEDLLVVQVGPVVWRDTI
jgi:hypothetical protein